MTNGFFITGTDTGIGKTWAALSVMAQLQGTGLIVNGMKPIASGCARRGGRLVNDDALQLRAQSSVSLDYAVVNPYAFAPPIAPHFAARRVGVQIALETISTAYAAIAANAVALVEGAGGWLVPLDDAGLGWADVVGALGLGVILVVGMRLGCINHALLSARAIESDGCRLLGWIANQIDPQYGELDTTIAYLQAALPAPYAGVLRHGDRGGAQSRLHYRPASGLDLSIFAAVSP